MSDNHQSFILRNTVLEGAEKALDEASSRDSCVLVKSRDFRLGRID